MIDMELQGIVVCLTKYVEWPRDGGEVRAAPHCSLFATAKFQICLMRTNDPRAR